jgi:hypothetical protein
MISTEFNYLNQEKVMHPLEQNMSNGCSNESLSKQKIDPRYKPLVLSKVSEYSLLNQNDILSKLWHLPAYGQLETVAPYDMSKIHTNYALYTRNTIPWKWTCEHGEKDVLTRDIAETLFSSEIISSQSSTALASLSTLFLIMTIISSIMFVMRD